MNNIELSDGYYWCRKSIYQVQIELGCYELTEKSTLLEKFQEKNYS